MNKTKIFFDIDKETEWLNSMAREGYRLEEKSWFDYQFEKCQPAQYIYQVERRTMEFKKKDREYIEFLRDLKIELIGHTWGYYYFEKANDGKYFAIYSDKESRIKHYKNVMKGLVLIALLNISIVWSHIIEPSGPWLLRMKNFEVSIPFLANTICFLVILGTCAKYGYRIIKLKKEGTIQDV